MKGKGPLGIMIGLGSPDGGDEEFDMASEAKVDAAKDALRAFKKGDAKALSDALERHYQACGDSSDDMDDDMDGG
jgi:DNA-binding GntR family transcriptional regulator